MAPDDILQQEVVATLEENTYVYGEEEESVFDSPISVPSVGIALNITSANSLIDSFTQYLAIMRGASGGILGLIVSTKQLGSALLQPLWGNLVDRYGRRKFLALGLIIIATIGVIMPLLPSAEWILALVSLQAIFGIMYYPAWNAWIGDRTKPSNRAQVFGKLSMLGVYSSMIVNLAVSFYMDIKDPHIENVATLRIPMFLSAVFAGISVIFVLFLSPEYPKQKVEVHTESLYRRVRATIKCFNKKFVRFITIEGIFYFAWASAWPIFPYVQFDVAGSWLDLAILQLFFMIPFGMSYFYGGRLADRIGYKKVLLLTRPALIIPPITAALGQYYHSIQFLYIGQFAVGATLGAASVSVNSLLMEYAPKDKRGTYISTHMMTIGVIGFLSSTIVGGILQILSGNNRPSDTLLIALLFTIAGMRAIANIGYYFLPDPRE